jgi:hypothetical protein
MNFRPSESQRVNAARNAGKAAAAKRQAAERGFDWDRAIVNLKAMLDEMDYSGEEHT